MSIVAHFAQRLAALGGLPGGLPNIGHSPLADRLHEQYVRRLGVASALRTGRDFGGGVRLDSAVLAKPAKEVQRHAYSAAMALDWARTYRDLYGRGGAGGSGERLDAFVPMASQGLTSFFEQVYVIGHAGLAAWDGDYLMIDSTTVDPAANDYVWYEMDLLGMPRAGSTYDVTTIPLVPGPMASSNTGKIMPFLIGMEINFMDERRAALARRNGKPDFEIERNKAVMCQRALAEAIDALWKYGDVGHGIDGLFSHPAIPVLDLGGAWSGKTSLQVMADLVRILNFIPNAAPTRLADRKKVFIRLPPTQFQLANSIPWTGSGSKTVMQAFRETWGLREDQVVEDQLLAAANSQVYEGGPNGLPSDTGFGVYKGAPDEATGAPRFILPQRPEVPAPERNNGLSFTTFWHARAGGLMLPDAQRVFLIRNF